MNKRGEGFLLGLEVMFMIYTLLIVLFGIVLIQSTLTVAKAENKYADEIQSSIYAYRLVNSPFCFGHQGSQRLEQYVIDLDKVSPTTLERCLPQTKAQVPLPVSVTVRDGSVTDYTKSVIAQASTSSWTGQSIVSTWFTITIIKPDGTKTRGSISINGLGAKS